MFDERNLNILEFPKILEMLAGYAQSESGKSAAQSIVPFSNISDAETALNETSEADKILFEYSVNPSFAVDNITEILTKSQKGAVLAIPDLIKIGRLLRVSRRLYKSLCTLNGVPLIYDKASLLFFDEELEKRIYEAFISETEVADNASQELKTIRQRIRRLNENVRNRLQTFITSPSYSKYLQDNIVTVRGDRYVIPVKSDFKGNITGLVHDQSASGSTLFIEPMQVVELNNDLKLEKINEQAEIERILRGFSMSVSAHADRLKESYTLIIDMDLVFAKAQLAHSQKAFRPTLTADGTINIKHGRHPLIDAAKVVPVTLKMEKHDKMLLITGPNTGGKTVTLKLAGLFVVMAMSGLYLPASDAIISVFDGVYCDIGDEQSIEQSLSTFSAHIKNIIEILDIITDKSLVLFDELGAGTDPSEGAALAVSIAEHVLKKGSRALITSHFNDLKEFALTTDGVVSASMEFDTETFSPTFKLVMGAIGSSNALYIASRLGLNNEIIDNAKKKLSGEKRAFDSVLFAAEETRRSAQRLVNEAAEDREKAAGILKDAEKEKRIVAEKREKLEESIRKETKRLIEDSVGDAEEVIDQIKELLTKQDLTENDLFCARKLKKQLENMSAEYGKENTVLDIPDDSPIKIGDDVFVKSLSKRGVLKSVSSRGEAEIAFGKINVKVKSGDYYKVKK